MLQIQKNSRQNDQFSLLGFWVKITVAYARNRAFLPAMLFLAWKTKSVCMHYPAQCGSFSRVLESVVVSRLVTLDVEIQ